jgi:hypothetical protein
LEPENAQRSGVKVTYLPLREVETTGEASALYDAWLGDVGERLAGTDTDRDEVVRDILRGIYFPASTHAPLPSSRSTMGTSTPSDTTPASL